LREARIVFDHQEVLHGGHGNHAGPGPLHSSFARAAKGALSPR
jgi:hypothetical protein